VEIGIVIFDTLIQRALNRNYRPLIEKFLSKPRSQFRRYLVHCAIKNLLKKKGGRNRERGRETEGNMENPDEAMIQHDSAAHH